MADTARGADSGVDPTARPVSAREIEEFRLRARAWLADNMPRLADDDTNGQLMRDDEMGVRARELQRILYDGGYAGLCFPVEYGGRGLTRAHQEAFTQESAPYEMPVLFNVPTFSILGATLLDFGNEEQKRRHIPAMLTGEELWVQFLSEPSGGSDLAGLVTRATQDGDVFVLNGSKIWSSGAFRSDYALCLARTNWHAPKHRGLTCFIVKIHQPGIEVQQIRMVNGWNEFCQEFFDDVAIPAENVVGQVNDGWTVASRLLFHERNAVGGASPYTSGLSGRGGARGGQRFDLAAIARGAGQTDDPRVRQLVAEARVNDRVAQQLVERVTVGIEHGVLPGTGRCFASPARGHQQRAQSRHRAGARRFQCRGVVRRGRPARRSRDGVPHAPGRQPRGWQQRDAAQHHQRTGARHAPGVRGRQGQALRRGTSQSDAHQERLTRQGGWGT